MKTEATRKEKRREIPSTFSMVRISCFPQYWAVRTAAPEVRPKKIRFMINWT